MNEKFEKLWEQIVETFDWNRVYQTMKLLDWQWQGDGIPSTNKLKRESRTMAYESFIDGKARSTGGFECRYDDGELEVKFVLESWVAK